MANCILIADSGSTKTDWILTTAEYGILEVQTMGINPVRDNQDAIFGIVKNELMPKLPVEHSVSAIHFYGAGCIVPYKESVEETLSLFFPTATIAVESDLLGAARALCGHEAGIACILGTGSNSCLYDGKEIVSNTPPLGYILGDEGGGAVLGKTLVSNILKRIFCQELQDSFFKRFSLTPANIINKVYREPMPNRFLASVVPFLAEHRNNPEIHQMLTSAFRQFFIRNVKVYQHPEIEIGFVGSIAYYFQEELNEAAQEEGLKIGKIVHHPAREIAFFHQNDLILAQKCKKTAKYVI